MITDLIIRLFSSSLLLLRFSSDLSEFIFIGSVKIFMMEVALPVILSNLVEIIHIQLSDEGRVIAVLEIARQYLSRKSILV
jgi:hypothetical protein